MTIPRVGDGRQVGDGNSSEPIMWAQAAPEAVTTSTTLTTAQISAGIILATPAGSGTVYTLPAAKVISNEIVSSRTGTCVDFRLSNQSTVYSVSLGVGIGITVGSGSLVIAPGESVGFRIRRTTSEAWVLYRLSGGVLSTAGADIVVDVTTGDAATLIQATLDAVKAAGRRSTDIKIKSNGAFSLTSGIVVNPWFHNVDFAGAVVTYTPTTGAAISIECDQVNVFTQLIGGVHNINLVGGTAVGNTSIGLYCYGTALSTRTSCAMYNITINGFSEGLTFDDYGYLTHFYGIVINGCRDYGLNQRAGAHDAGENISLHGGAISNCVGGQGTAILASDDSSEIILYGMSIDYNLKVARIVGGGRVYMNGGHIEFNGGTASADQVYISGQSMFAIEGVYWVVNTSAGAGPYSYANMVNVVDTNSTFTATNSKFTNHRNTADIWATGTGKVLIEKPALFNVSLMPYSMYGGNNVLADGGFTQTTMQDLWYVTSQAGTYTSRYQKSDGIVVVSSTDTARTGTRSLKVTRGNVGAGYGQGLRLMIPVSGYANKAMFCRFWANSTLGANTVMSFYQAIISTYDAVGVPVYVRRTAYAAPFQTTNIPNDWTTMVGVQNGSAFRVAPWATHVEIEFDISAGAALTSLYIDDFVCEFY